MKKLSIFICLLAIGCAPASPYKYKIEGSINTKNGIRPAIWYTDTISFNEDTAFYKNSDGSVVKIPQPYRIYEEKR
jgi:hypothetical protein